MWPMGLPLLLPHSYTHFRHFQHQVCGLCLSWWLWVLSSWAVDPLIHFPVMSIGPWGSWVTHRRPAAHSDSVLRADERQGEEQGNSSSSMFHCFIHSYSNAWYLSVLLGCRRTVHTAVKIACRNEGQSSEKTRQRGKMKLCVNAPHFHPDPFWLKQIWCGGEQWTHKCSFVGIKPRWASMSRAGCTRAVAEGVQ